MINARKNYTINTEKKAYNPDTANNKKEVIIPNIKVVVLFKLIMDNLIIKINIFQIHLTWGDLISPSKEQNKYLKKPSEMMNYIKLVFLISEMIFLIMILSSAEARKSKKLLTKKIIIIDN